MELPALFDHALPSVVGFISLSQWGNPKILKPDIFGTGFLVTEDGLVVTNRHVTKAFTEYPCLPRTGALGVATILQLRNINSRGYGGGWQMVTIVGWNEVNSFRIDEKQSTDLPDLAFVQLDLRANPYLKLNENDFAVQTGKEITTLGYPPGTRRAPDGEIKQVGPFFRKGLVSSVFPFDVPHPVGFSIDILQQGGSSGSPILDFAGNVVGMMAASAIDYVNIVDRNGIALECYAASNTNISICVSASVICSALHSYREQDHLDKSRYQEYSKLTENTGIDEADLSWTQSSSES